MHTLKKESIVYVLIDDFAAKLNLSFLFPINYQGNAKLKHQSTVVQRFLD